MNKYMAELIAVLSNRPHRAYDFIANNWHQFSREEQRQIALELLYAMHVSRAPERIYFAIANELREIYEEE